MLKNYTLPIKQFVRNQEIDKEIKNNLRKLMWEYVAIARNSDDLKSTLIKIDTFLKEDVGRLLFFKATYGKIYFDVRYTANKLSWSSFY